MTATAHFDYLIVGSGLVTEFAVEGIRERDDEGSIGILSDHVDASPVHPMSGGRAWDDPQFGLGDADFDATIDRVVLDATVSHIDRGTRTLTTTTGERYRYDKLLLATGAQPRRVDLPEDERVIWFARAADQRRLAEIASRHEHVAVVGGSFLGTELAAALVDHGCRVTLAFRGDVLGSAVLPPGVALAFQDSLREHGVEVRGGSRVSDGTVDADGVELRFENGSSLRVDAVVSGLGIKPNVELARDAGLMTADGIVVDEQLRTSDQHIFAAGDVAEFPDVLLGRRRVEHVDTATAMGHTAGRNMAGEYEQYDHTPYYYAVVFGTRFEAIGAIDASFETIEDWIVPLEQGVIYYLRDGLVAGVLLWNVSDRLDEARAVIAHAAALRGQTLAGLIRP